jgi:hypothetical protein
MLKGKVHAAQFIKLLFKDLKRSTSI